jgi:hypothetical protein
MLKILNATPRLSIPATSDGVAEELAGRRHGIRELIPEDPERVGLALVLVVIILALARRVEIPPLIEVDSRVSVSPLVDVGPLIQIRPLIQIDAAVDILALIEVEPLI